MSHLFALVKISLSIGGILLKDAQIATEADKYNLFYWLSCTDQL